MTDAEVFAALKADLVQSVVTALKSELRKANVALLTVPEVARKYRRDVHAIRRMVADGLIKCREVKPRNGRKSYLVDAIDAERVLGAT